MNRPHIICHMVTSIDGKVTGEFLSRPECEKATEIYYEINRNYKADGFICGRETMQESFAGKEDAPRYKYKNVEVPSGDFIGDKNAKFFAVSFDRHGHIGWESNYIKDEDKKLLLNDKLQIILNNIKEISKVTFTYFIYDEKKIGGKYITINGIVKKINITEGYVILTDKTKIPIEEIIDINSDLFKDYQID